MLTRENQAQMLFDAIEQARLRQPVQIGLGDHILFLIQRIEQLEKIVSGQKPGQE